VKEVQANELAQKICKGIGSGGGHTVKAGGTISMELIVPEYENYCAMCGTMPRMVQSADGRSERPSDSAIKAVLERRLVDYFVNSQAVDTGRRQHKPNGGTIRGVVFDLDGTLLDTLEDLADAVNYALRAKNMPTRSIDEVRRFVGNGVELLMIRAMEGGRENPQFEETFALFKEYYGAHCKDHTGPYPDVLFLMEELKQRGIRMAIVSNKLDGAVKELDREYFHGYTTAAIGEMEGVARKPAPDTVEKALEALGLFKEETVYVGDSDVDIQTAKNAGIPCISVTWGFRDEAFLKEHGAQQIIHKPLELLALI
jgi:phosphoglycolate phosphatase